MNKKMKELFDAIGAKLASAQTHMEAGETEEAAADMDAADALQKQHEMAERIYKAQQREVPKMDPPPADEEEDELGGGKGKSFDGFQLIAKCLRGQSLTEEERGLIEPDPAVVKALTEKALVTGDNAVSGENLLIPEDVRNTILELRRSFQSAKDIVTVIPTTVLAGSFTWEKGSPVGLIAFEDGDDVPDGEDPKFKNVKYAISFKGAILYISNILTVTEAAGLSAYLNRWFVKNAIISENADIFSGLKNGKTAKELSGLAALKDCMELDLDPDSLIGGIIVTNQTGFNRMGNEKDANGRSLLQDDPTQPTRKLYNGLPIRVFSNAQLPDVSGKAPVFYGNTESGVYFMEFKYMLFATSAHAGFKSNKTLMRIIEGYDVIEADKEAYSYGLLAAPTAAPASLMGDEPVAPVNGESAPYTEESLTAQTNAELWAIAQTVGAQDVTSSSTKDKLVAAILAVQAAK